jgi:hypothetical protein
MSIEKFIPLSPDPYLNEGSDMSLAKFGHLNTLVDYVNSTLYGFSRIPGTGRVKVSGVDAALTVGSVAIGVSPTSVWVEENYAYVTNEGSSTLSIVNITNPLVPAIVATLTMNDGVQNYAPKMVKVYNHLAYVLCESAADGFSNKTFIINVGDAKNPVILSSSLSIGGGYYPQSFSIDGSIFYGTRIGDFCRQDISNPSLPVNLYPCVGTGIYVADISTKGQYTYVIGGDYSGTYYAKFAIYDMTTPRNPVTKSTVTIGTNERLSGMAIDEDYGYFFSALGGKFYIYDLTDKTNPVQISTYTLTGFTPDPDSYAYGKNYTNVCVQANYVYLTDGTTGNVHVFDVTNKALPVYVRAIPSGTTKAASFYIKGTYMYVVGNDSSLLNIIDLGGLYIQQAEIGGLYVSNFAVKNSASISYDLNVYGNINVNRGIKSYGPLSSYVNGAIAFRVNRLFGVEITPQLLSEFNADLTGLTIKPTFNFNGNTGNSIAVTIQTPDATVTNTAVQVLNNTTTLFKINNAGLISLGNQTIAATKTSTGEFMQVSVNGNTRFILLYN